MKRQCMDLKKQFTIDGRKYFDQISSRQRPTCNPTTLCREAGPGQQRGGGKSDNDAREDFVSATNVASKVIDEADSDGSVDFDGQTPNGELDEDSVMSQTQVFPVNEGGGDGKQDNNAVAAVEDEAIDAAKPNLARVLPSKSISKTAVPPRGTLPSSSRRVSSRFPKTLHFPLSRCLLRRRRATRTLASLCRTLP